MLAPFRAKHHDLDDVAASVVVSDRLDCVVHLHARSAADATELAKFAEIARAKVTSMMDRYDVATDDSTVSIRLGMDAGAVDRALDLLKAAAPPPAP
jgi:dihydrodipicolinate synthase/N-acetylneuraminate lyase